MSSEPMTQPATKSKGGRPVGYKPQPKVNKTPAGIEMTLEGDFILIKIPKKSLTRKLLSELM